MNPFWIWTKSIERSTDIWAGYMRGMASMHRGERPNFISEDDDDGMKNAYDTAAHGAFNPLKPGEPAE